MNEGKYSLDQALYEAGKMSQLTGETATPDEYKMAAEMVESELVDSYSNFDKRFFAPRTNGGSEENNSQELEGLSDRYKRILESQDIQDILAGRKSVTEISPEISRELERLIEQEQKYGDVMAKHAGLDNIQTLLTAAGVQNIDQEKLGYLSGRVRNHLFRLLLPEKYDARYIRDIQRYVGEGAVPVNTISPAFAKDYLSYVETLPDPDPEDARHITEVIGVEGDDVKAFWTLAPYVNDELKRKGLDSTDAMAQVFEWIRAAKGSYKQDRTLETGKNSNLGVYRYDYVLGWDERMPSHLLSRLYAKSVVEKLTQVQE